MGEKADREGELVAEELGLLEELKAVEMGARPRRPLGC